MSILVQSARSFFSLFLPSPPLISCLLIVRISRVISIDFRPPHTRPSQLTAEAPSESIQIPPEAAFWAFLFVGDFAGIFGLHRSNRMLIYLFPHVSGVKE